MPKANVEDANTLKELVACVRLDTPLHLRADSPQSRPVAGMSTDPADVFEAILDPLFDEDVYMRRMKTEPPMPLGDHC